MKKNKKRFYYKIHSYRFSLACEESTLSEELENLFFSLKAKKGPVATQWRVVVSDENTEEKAVFSLYEDERFILETDDIEKIIEETEWGVTLRILEKLSSFIQIHASGVKVDENALLFCGPPGSGKSVLATSLLLNGFPCFSDEIVLVDPQSLTIYPFPRSFHLEQDTAKQLPQLKKYVQAGNYLDASGKLRLNPSLLNTNWCAKPARAKWLVFPDYGPGNKNELVTIGHTEAISLIIDQAINLKDYGNGGIDVVLNLVQSCSSFIFKAKDFNSASILTEKLQSFST
jgi:hypothetical protein